MILLFLGLALWAAAHFYKRALPDHRAALGDKAKGIVAATLLLAVVLMVLGYRAAPFTNVWFPPDWTRPVNNLMVLIAFYMTSPAAKKGRLLTGMRHPMLIGFSLWAVAHLMVNGDLASVLLFGGLLIWALAEIVVINRSEPQWAPPTPGPIAKDAIYFGASILLVGVVGYIHGLIGPSAFG